VGLGALLHLSTIVFYVFPNPHRSGVDAKASMPGPRGIWRYFYGRYDDIGCTLDTANHAMD